MNHPSEPQSKPQLNWSRVFWVLLANQFVISSVLALVSIGLLRESYRASEAASLELPRFSETYMLHIRQVGMMLAVAVSLVLSTLAVMIRKRFVAIVVVTLSFVSCVIFLTVGMIAAFIPLLVAIRDSLPPAEQW